MFRSWKRWITGLAIVNSIFIAGTSFAQDAAEDSLAEKVGQMGDEFEGVKERLSVAESDILGLKKFKVSGYVQARYEYHDDASSTPLKGTAGTESANQGKLLNRFFVTSRTAQGDLSGQSECTGSRLLRWIRLRSVIERSVCLAPGAAFAVEFHAGAIQLAVRLRSQLLIVKA